MYRYLEIFPGLLSWLTIALIFLTSWKLPVAAAVFIILFDIYWLLRTFYLTIHLRTTFKKMQVNIGADWAERLKPLKWQHVYHLIVLPMYKEPYAVIRETFQSLAKSNYLKEKIIVVLGTEERAGAEAKETAEKIAAEFKNSFFKLLITTHPANLPNEIPGKGSNETWATRQVKKEIIDPLAIPYEHILISTFDIDTQILPDYLNVLTYTFLLADKPQRSSFQPIPFYTNNIYRAPALARILSFSSTFWQMMQQSSPEKLVTFSSHSMPFKALVELGYWQTNVVSEDSRIFWQLYLHFKGDWRTVPLFYPVSMDANADPSFFKTLLNLYRQQRRWAWGVENFPYFAQNIKGNPNIPRRNKAFWLFHLIYGFHSWATNSLIIFFLGWLPIAIGGANFTASVLSANLPRITSWIMTGASIGIASSAILSIILLPPKPTWVKDYHYVLYILQWVLLPVTLIIFGCIPALEAQTRLMLGGKFRLNFWVTPKSRHYLTQGAGASQTPQP